MSADISSNQKKPLKTSTKLSNLSQHSFRHLSDDFKLSGKFFSGKKNSFAATQSAIRQVTHAEELARKAKKMCKGREQKSRNRFSWIA